MTQLNFNAASVRPDFGAKGTIPEGWYNVTATTSEAKPTKDGSGVILVIGFKVMDGEHANTIVDARFNIRNKSQQAMQIAYGQLSALAHCVGVLQVADSQQLHNIPLQIKVAIRQSPGYAPQNEVNGYAKYGEPQAPVMPTFQPAPVAAPQAAPVAAAWAPPATAQPWAQQPAPVAAPQASPVATPQAAPVAGQPAWASAPVPQATDKPETAARAKAEEATPVNDGFDPASATPPWATAPSA